jgi:outer membrane protein TolC
VSTDPSATRLLLAAVLVVLGVASVTPSAAAQQQRTPVTIGILTDGPLLRFGELVEQIERETAVLLENRFVVDIGGDARLAGDHTVAGIRAALDQLLDRVDVVVVVGTMGAQVAADHPRLAKPVVAPFVLDPSLQDIPRQGAASGVSNFVYLTRPENRDLATLAEVVALQRLAVLVSASAVAEMPGLEGRIEQQVAQAGAEAVVVPVGDDVQSVLDTIEAAGADAVYVLPLSQLSGAAFERLADGLIRLGLASLSWFGEPEVRQGILLARRPDSFTFQLARLTALTVEQILRGGAPGQLRVTFVPQERVIVNMETARAIGVFPSWTMLSDARLIEQRPGVAPEPQSLDSIVREALAQNQDLASFERALQAAAQDVKTATSRLLPQLDLAFAGTIIDEDRAARSLGTMPERMLMGSVGLSQVVYADRAWADRTVQQSLQRAREEDYASLRLDVSFEAADAYLTVLRRKTTERIRRENLAFTRTNLDLADVRRQTGAATPGEVLRWQAQVSKDRQGVVGAGAARAIAEIRLKRLLHRPLGEEVTTPEDELEDPVIRWAEDALMRLLDDPQRFDGFQDFMIAEALVTSPELRALDALIGGQERAVTAANRSFWLPEFFLDARLSNRLLEGGAGSDFSGGGLPPGLVPEGEADPWRWSIQLSARYLLFGSGSRTAAKERAQQSLFSLEYQRTSQAQRVEEAMRDALQRMLSSRVRLELAREAATAAEGNYEFVRAAYAGGVTGILSLLDAQNTALIAELDAANALYDFITDFMAVQRAAGQIDLFIDEASREAFIQRLGDYLRERGME